MSNLPNSSEQLSFLIAQGLVCLEKKDFAKSLCYLEQARTMACSNGLTQRIPEIFSALGRVYANLGKAEDACIISTGNNLICTRDILATIHELGQEVISSLDTEKVMDRAYRCINRLMEAHVLGIALYDEDNAEIDYKLVIANAQHLAPFKKSLYCNDSVAAVCIREKKDVIVADMYAEKLKYLGSDQYTGPRSVVYSPLEVNNAIVGVITVQNHNPGVFTPEHVEIIKTFGSYISIALDNALQHDKVKSLNQLLQAEKKQLAQMNEQIKHMANHDPLTKLPNRRLLMELLQQQIRISKREKKQFALLYLDLDGFKPVNDTYGHDTGDAVLVVLAQRMKKVLRDNDIVSRLGGDEFVIILEDIHDRKACELVTRKILSRIKKPVSANSHNLALHGSIGLSLYPHDSEDAEVLLKLADIAMYAVKKSGKSGFIFYDQVLPV